MQLAAIITLKWVLLVPLNLMLLHHNHVPNGVDNTPYLTTFHIIIYYRLIGNIHVIIWARHGTPLC